MKKNILVKGFVTAAIAMSAFSSIANAGVVDEVRKECSNYSESVTKDPNSTLNRTLKAANNFDCISVAKLDKKKKVQKLKDDLIEAQQKTCLEVLQNQCDMNFNADDSSKCFLHKDADNVPDYAIFYNEDEDKKLFSTIKGIKNYRCHIEQTAVAEDKELSQTKLFSGNLIVVTDGKVMFFDDSGTLRELLSGQGKSYNNMSGASIEKVSTAFKKGEQVLVLQRKYSENSDKTQEIDIKESTLKDEKRSEVVELDTRNTKTVYLKDGKKVLKVEANVIK